MLVVVGAEVLAAASAGGVQARLLTRTQRVIMRIDSRLRTDRPYNNHAYRRFVERLDVRRVL